MTIRNFLPFLLLFVSIDIYSINLIPLDEYIKKRGMDNDAREYVAKRCSGLNLEMIKWLPEGELLETAREDYELFFKEALIERYLRLPESDLDLAMENIHESIKNISLEINRIMRNSSDLRGNVWEGNSILADVKFCTRHKILVENSE